jgi:3-oxoacyl-[acyl-carrier protein] reductase
MPVVHAKIIDTRPRAEREAWMDLGLKGKVALVTAASKGMGKACALGLAAEGARVAMCARTEGDLKAAVDEVKAATKGDVIGVAADVTKLDQVRTLVGRVKDALGAPDILIANCGGPPRGYFDEFADDAWYGAVEVSLMSTVRLIREVLPGMRARRWGRILTIQSVSVKQPLAELLLSNAVRPGVAGLMKTLALQLGKENILVNTLCPGRILTDRLMGGLAASGLSREEYLARQGAEIPLGRVGTVEEFASVAVFLASERASYVTGVALQVDGGLVRGLL